MVAEYVRMTNESSNIDACAIRYAHRRQIIFKKYRNLPGPEYGTMSSCSCLR